MTSGMQVEIERKFDVDGQAALPRLQGVGGIGQVRYRPPVALEAVYFDTAARELAANKVTLRRRTGGPDEGWHVKIASGEHRLELHEPLRASDRKPSAGTSAAGAAGAAAQVRVPRRILGLVQVHVRGRTLIPVAQLNTLRAVVELVDSRGRMLAELADDHVAAMAVGRRASSRVQHWREWEVELIDPDPVPDPTPEPQSKVTGAQPLLDVVGKVLEAAGARPSAASSKVEKVLGAVPDPLDPAAVELSGELQAVLTRTVRAQLKLLKEWDPLVRRDVEGSIHQFRVVSRTLRSILQTYQPLLEPESTQAVTDALKRLGRLLSTARDAEVVRDQVDERIAALPGGAEGPAASLVTARVAKRLRRAKQEEFARAHDVLLKRMRQPAYAAALDLLDDYARQVPLAPATAPDTPARQALEPLAAQQVDAVLTLARTAAAEQDPHERIELMHEVRKEAKRLRYAVTAVHDATGLDWGEELLNRMKTAKKLQEVLGRHRDSIMFQEHVATTARRAAKQDQDTFGYGLLYAAEFPVQGKAETKAEKLLSRLTRA